MHTMLLLYYYKIFEKEGIELEESANAYLEVYKKVLQLQ